MTGMDWELLDRYLARECTAEERERVERWMDASPLNRRRVELLADVVAASPAVPRVEVRELIEQQIDRPRKRFSLGVQPAQSALFKVAVLVLVVGGAVLAWRSVFWDKAEAPASVPAMRVITTPPGQRASFRLPDGTSVMLGVASTLRHPVSYGVGRREVQLVGEAYFEVVHDEERVFVVRAGDLVAEDLGTEFVVRAYRNDRHALVVVRTGKVEARARAGGPDSAPRVLLPGQLGRIDAGGKLVAEQADTAAYFAWTEGRLVFDDVPLRDAIPQLGRWYDLEFRLADSSLGQVRLTATFKNQATEDALELLAASLGMRQVRSGRTVTFHRATGAR
jgi:transmembrane sensor